MATFQAVLHSDDDESKASEEEFYEAGNDMETDATATEHSHQSPFDPQEEESKSQDAEPESSSSARLAKYDDSEPLTESKLMKFLGKACNIIYIGITDDVFDMHT